jgi:hypothetical protein
MRALTDLVNAKPFGDAFPVVNMLAWQFYLPVASFVPHLANHTSVCRQYQYEQMNSSTKK